MEVEGVTGVRFIADDGTAVLPPTDDEGNVDRPVTAADYGALRF